MLKEQASKPYALKRTDWVTGAAIFGCLKHFTTPTEGQVVFVDCGWESHFTKPRTRFIPFHGLERGVPVIGGTEPKLLIYMVNPGDCHWCVLFLFPENREIMLLDPFFKHEYQLLGQKAVFQYIAQGARLGWDVKTAAGDWKFAIETTSTQTNTYDCGRMVIEGARRFIDEDRLTLLTTDMDDVHQYILKVLTIIFSFPAILILIRCMHGVC